MWSHVQEELLATFKTNPQIVSLANDLERQVHRGYLSPGFASDLLLNDFFKNL